MYISPFLHVDKSKQILIYRYVDHNIIFLEQLMFLGEYMYSIYVQNAATDWHKAFIMTTCLDSL